MKKIVFILSVFAFQFHVFAQSGGDLDLPFNSAAGPNNLILGSAIQPDGKIIIGGYFSTFNGASINRIARLNADGSRDTTFNPGLGGNDYGLLP